MATFVKGAEIENALSYELYKKSGTSYSKLAKQLIGKITAIEVGKIQDDGSISRIAADVVGWKCSDFIHVEQLVDDASTSKCLHVNVNQSAINDTLLGFYTGPNDATYVGGLSYDYDRVGITAEAIKDYAYSIGAQYVVVCSYDAEATVTAWVNLTRDILFYLDGYDSLTTGETYQLVVKAIGEGGEDIDGDDVIYADSDYGGDADGNPLEWTKP